MVPKKVSLKSVHNLVQVIVLSYDHHYILSLEFHFLVRLDYVLVFLTGLGVDPKLGQLLKIV